ncbi:universal stress protein PHOS32 isoform X1 [Populus alba]|uniref:universal stress protein PHOS32 isoform X1 n=1 Tax=Populus alba TaxID=43335 RepID=UPI00158E6166|nr:universal stress protein PHOS32-like isoform X1 [Populus alba]
MASSPSPKKNTPTESAVVVQVQPPSPRLHVTTQTTGAQRRIGIAVDLSDESAFAVKWAVQNYLRSGDAVILVHVSPTNVLYGADWGSLPIKENYNLDDQNEENQQKIEEDFNLFTSTKANDIAQPLVDANIPFKIHIVKDHDMKERLCLEVERLGLSAVVMGSRGFGASRKSSKGRLGSVSDYCVHHCVCPVIVVRFPDEKDGGAGEESERDGGATLCTVMEEEQEEHDMDGKQSDYQLCWEALQSSMVLSIPLLWCNGLAHYHETNRRILIPLHEPIMETILEVKIAIP